VSEIPYSTEQGIFRKEQGNIRQERYNPALDAIVATDIPAARKRARSADRALAKGMWGPFYGVPMTRKPFS
jgi:Asp-tRNA(Asn)/Glu-tRNA(Gln) amidotransferase A subunit family amidase